MEQGVITNITGNGNWEGKYGIMYSFIVEFENGVTVEANSKSQLAPYGLGDTVWYEVTRETEYGKKGKISRTDPNVHFQSVGGQSKSNPDIQARIDASWSMGQAISILGSVDKVDESTLQVYLQEVRNLSTLLLEIRNQKL